MSRAVRFHRTGGPEVLQLDEVDVPAPARMRFKSVSRRSASTGPR